MTASPRQPALAPGTCIGIVGAGAMGAGIAQVAARAGHPVLLYDTRPEAAANAIQGIGATLHKMAAKGRFTAEQASAVHGRLRAARSLNDLASCSLIVEAIVENLEAKREVFRALEGLTSSETLFATNTSSLSITAIASDLRHPERLAGMHFFNPAPLMPLVEIVCGLETGEGTLQVLEATALAWGKEPVRARSTPGCIVNRIARPFYAEALRLLDETVADPATLDAVLRESGGFRMGPFELMDLIGNDVNFAVTCSVFEAFFHDPRFTPSVRQKELVDAGRLGRKSGQGFYAYAAGAEAHVPRTLPAEPFPAATRLFGNDPLTVILRGRLKSEGHALETSPSRSDGCLAETAHATLYRTDGRSATQRARDTQMRNVVLVDLACDHSTATRLALSVADQAGPSALNEIAGLLQAGGFAVSALDDAPGMAVMRTVAMLANEAADTVHQGVCTVLDCDKAMRLGVNYPQGPLGWADALGSAFVATVLDHMAAAYGTSRYRVSPLLRRKAMTGSTFHDARLGIQDVTT